MEINKKSSSVVKKVVNPEGSIVLDRDPRIQLYLEASNLNIKGDKFYQTADAKLKSVMNLAKTQDIKYVEGLSRFLTDSGLKLSPVVLLSVLSDRKNSFRDKNFSKIFNTPERIAEAIGLQNLGLVKLNNSFKEHTLREALENMSDYTLRKHKMKRRNIKTKDLIKYLRPTPKNDKFSKLYKAIIEDGKLAKMKEDESFVRVKSSTKMTEKEKIKYLKDNIETIPLNELIRNLRFITDNCNFKDEVALEKKVIKRLNSIDDMRFLNIFDLIETAIHVPQLEKALFEVVNNFVDKVKKQAEIEGNTQIMFDVSGSMSNEGTKNGFKYFVIFALMFDDCYLRFFGSNLHPYFETAPIVPLIRKGRISEAYKKFYAYEGTALVDSAKELLREVPSTDNFIVISDEVSWQEGSDLSYEIDRLSKALTGKKVILINPQVYKGTVFKGNVLAMSSLTSSVIYNTIMMTNPRKFVKYIEEYQW